MDASRGRRASSFFASAGVLAALLCRGCVAGEFQKDVTTPTGNPAPGETPASLPGANEFGAPGAPGCAPASPILRGEVLGTSRVSEVSAFGLLFVGEDGLTHREQLKLVTRITGSGDFSARLRDPDGTSHSLAWGPKDHFGSSNYARPGDEWGMGLDFDRPGCWNLQLFRGAAHVADFWLPVS